MKKYEMLIALAIGLYALILFLIGTFLSQLLPGLFPVVSYFLLGVWLFLIFKEVKHSWLQIHKPYVMVLEEKGDFHKILEPGLYFVFQRFGLFSFPKEEGIFLGEQSVPFEAVIPFKNVIGGVKAEIIIQVKDDGESIKKFVYNHHDPIRMIISASQASLRHFFSKFTIDGANRKQGLVDLDVLFNYVEEGKIGKKKKSKKKGTEKKTGTVEVKNIKKWEDTEFGKRVVACGIEAISFKIVSIEYPETIEEYREAVYGAERKKQVAKHDGDAKIILAKATEKAKKHEGVGERSFIEERHSAFITSLSALLGKMDSKEAAELLKAIDYNHTALQNAEKLIVINSSNSNAGTGAELAAGIGAMKEGDKPEKTES